MVIEIPPDYQDYSVQYYRYGGLLEPISGGAIQNIVRLGDRVQLSVTAMPQDMADEGLVFTSRLFDADRDEAIMDWPINAEPRSGAGAPLVDGTVAANAVVLPVKGATPGFVFKEGLWMSVVHAGRRYMVRARGGDATVTGLGTVNLLIDPPFRVALSNNDVIEVARPRIQGVLVGDRRQWSQGSGSHSRPISFAIRERK